jgi:hypothetical protein
MMALSGAVETHMIDPKGSVAEFIRGALGRGETAPYARLPIGLRRHKQEPTDRATIKGLSTAPCRRLPMNSDMMLQGVAAVAALALYFLPSIVADRRKRHDVLTIALFNACMGWTVFGWLVALYWAFQPNPPLNLEREVVRSRRVISMRSFTTMLSERVNLRASRERPPK